MSLSGPAPASVGLQGGVQQPLTSQLRPRASGSSGNLLRDLGVVELQAQIGILCFQVATHTEAARKATLIFACVHREHCEFLKTLAPHVQGKVRVESLTCRDLNALGVRL